MVPLHNPNVSHESKEHGEEGEKVSESEVLSHTSALNPQANIKSPLFPSHDAYEISI